MVEVGEGVDRFKVGDRVAATHHVPCNTCRYCLNGDQTMCDTLLKGTHFDPGGFCDYLRLPAINVDRGTFLIPDGTSYEAASFMEPLACVLRGQRRAGVKPAQTVLILGAGLTGLLHIPTAHCLGAGLVIAADTIPYRLDKAVEMGANHVFQADENLIDNIRRVNGGYLADQVIICYDGFIDLGLDAIERGGTVLLFAGAAEGQMLPKNINDIFWRSEVTLTGTYAGAPRDCSQALQLIAAGSAPVEKIITHRLPLEQASRAFDNVCRPFESGCLKVVLTPHVD